MSFIQLTGGNKKMKKAIALLATLVVLTSSAFAQLAPTISGSAETKWGVNLDDKTNGFETSTSVTVKVPVVTSETKASTGEDAFGSASITGPSLSFNFDLDTFNDDGRLRDYTETTGEKDFAKGTDASISAKIDFANGVYATIGNRTGLAANFASGDKNYWVNPTFGEENGVSVGYKNDMLSAELTVANETAGYVRPEVSAKVDATYEGKTDVIADKKIVKTAEVGQVTKAAEDKDGYMVGAKAMYTAGDIFTLDFQMGTSATATLDATAKKTGVAVKVVSKPMEGLTITVPFDYLMAKDGSAMEALPAVAFSAGALALGLDFHYITVAKALASTLSADYTGTKLNANVAYTLDAGTAKVTVGSSLGEMKSDMDFSLKLDWTAAMYNVTLNLNNVIKKDGDKINFNVGVKPVAGVNVAVETTLMDGKTSFALNKLNIDLSSELTTIENTVFTINYSGFKTTTPTAMGTFYVGAKISL